MNLFDDITSPKDQSEIESLDKQTCTYILFLTLEEKDELLRLLKPACEDLIPDAQPDRKNASDTILQLLRTHYGE